jgi:hypothetical protein
MKMLSTNREHLNVGMLVYELEQVFSQVCCHSLLYLLKPEQKSIQHGQDTEQLLCLSAFKKTALLVLHTLEPLRV